MSVVCCSRDALTDLALVVPVATDSLGREEREAVTHVKRVDVPVEGLGVRVAGLGPGFWV